MVGCAYCEHNLICDTCRAPYEPADEAEYHALSRPEMTIFCHSCDGVLRCLNCKMPYDGLGDDEAE